MVFDITTRHALSELENGNTEPLAELVESGYTKNLHETLQYYPKAREKWARAMRTGKPLKQGEKRNQQHLAQRDRHLCGRVAYWIGRGMDDQWQDSKEGTVWHLAAEEVPSVSAPRLQKIWQATKRRPDGPCLMRMTHNFCRGVEHELASDVDGPDEFLRIQWQKAVALGLTHDIYAPEFMRLEFMLLAQDAK